MRYQICNLDANFNCCIKVVIIFMSMSIPKILKFYLGRKMLWSMLIYFQLILITCNSILICTNCWFEQVPICKDIWDVAKCGQWPCYYAVCNAVVHYFSMLLATEVRVRVLVCEAFSAVFQQWSMAISSVTHPWSFTDLCWVLPLLRTHWWPGGWLMQYASPKSHRF